MEIAKEVILDLLPVYLSGEASPATRVLIEEYLTKDPDLARSVRSQLAEGLDRAVPPSLPPELELRSLRRTRKLMRRQMWLFAMAITFTALSLSSELRFAGGRIAEFRFLFLDSPLFTLFLSLGILCWLAYFVIRRRLRTTVT